MTETKHIINSICAFDIGIKNLSFCILSQHNNIKTIDNWSLIDLRGFIPECIYKNKKNNVCHKEAHWISKIDQNIAYCKNHYERYDYSIPKTSQISGDQLKTTKCVYCHDDKTCNKSGKYIFDKKTYCSCHYKQILSRYKSDRKLCKFKKNSCMKEPLYELGTRMYEKLDSYPDILKSDKIVIENQPSLTNPTMKSISVLLLSYFIMKKHKCVEFVSPSGKLKVNEKLTKNILSKCLTKPIKYSVTKELGIKYSYLLMKQFSNQNNWTQLMETSKKKDDLCDAFLHAFYHFFGSGNINSQKDVDTIQKYFDDVITNKTNRKSKSNKHTKEDIIKLS